MMRAWMSSLVGSVHTQRWVPVSTRMISALGSCLTAFSLCSGCSEEGDLTKEQAHALTEHIWNDEIKRNFVLAVSATISGRHDGLNNDQTQFPKIGDLGLSSISTPTLL